LRSRNIAWIIFPERKPWRKRATVQDQVFAQELEKIEKELRGDEA